MVKVDNYGHGGNGAPKSVYRSVPGKRPWALNPSKLNRGGWALTWDSGRLPCDETVANTNMGVVT